MLKKDWERARTLGIWRYVLLHGVLYFGLAMMVINAFWVHPFENGFWSPAAQHYYVTWIITGAVYGIISWYLMQYRFRNKS